MLKQEPMMFVIKTERKKEEDKKEEEKKVPPQQRTEASLRRGLVSKKIYPAQRLQSPAQTRAQL